MLLLVLVVSGCSLFDKKECPECEVCETSKDESTKKEVAVETSLHHIDNRNNDIQIPKIVNGGPAAEQLNQEIIIGMYTNSYWYQNAAEWKETGCKGTYEYTIKNGVLVIFTTISPKGEFAEGGLISYTRDSYYFYDIEKDKRLSIDEAIISLGLQERLEEIESSTETCPYAGFVWEDNDIKLEPNCP